MTLDVDAYMAALRHPLKAEAQALREIIKGADKAVTEQIKWNAPSFSSSGGYIVTFNLRPAEHVHLVFHNPRMSEVSSDLLHGPWRDRRMAYFASMADVRANKRELVRIVKTLVRLNAESVAR